MANNANILLHGLFVLQYQGNKLIAMTPNFNHHQFLVRQQGQQGTDHGPFPNPFPQVPQDLNFTHLAGNTVKQSFPSSMPQFSKTTTGVGDLFANPGLAKNYRCRIEFNLPIDIMILRSRGNLSDYHSDPNSIVGQDIHSKSGPSLGLITLLHYETSGPSFTTSIFAEHRTPPFPATMMNPALTAARAMFTNGGGSPGFDLQLVDCPTCNVPTICPDNPVPPKAQGFGVQQDDEHSFGEIYDKQNCAKPGGTDVANCVQFGLLD